MKRNTSIKISKKKILPSVAVCFISVFAFSQLSWSILLPNFFWQGLLIFALILFMVDRVINRIKPELDLYVVLSVLMIGIIILWNNYDIQHNGLLPQAYNIIVFIFYWMSKDSNKWHSTLLKMMLICGVFYTIWTYICVLVPPVYNGFVFPMMKPWGYIQDNKAGFTAFYATNGLYMCIGIIAFFSLYYFNSNRKKTTFDKYISMALLVGMLLSGKRGQFLAMVIAIFTTYYFYNSNKKHGRIIKIIGICIIVFIVLYFISFYIPEVNTIIERFQEQSQKNDISSGRFLMWGRAWLLFQQQPFVGRGWRYFRYSPFTLVDYDVHNVFLQLLVEVGIIGSIPFFVFIFGYFISSIRLLTLCRQKQLLEPYIVYISVATAFETFFIVMCATGTALYQFEYMMPYLACCGMISYYGKLCRKEREKR